MFAHSLAGQPRETWEPLQDHLRAVGRRAAELADTFGFAEVARLAGHLHDIGKSSSEFQAYITMPEGPRRGPDHSTAGARVAAASYPGPVGRLLAAVIAGHHAGLPDGAGLAARLGPGNVTPPPGRWEDMLNPLAPMRALAPRRAGIRSPHGGFTDAFLTRMIFSALVDADSLETEAFYARAGSGMATRGGHADIRALRARMLSYLEGVRARARRTSLNDMRDDIVRHAVGRASLPPGLFTLTVPTGGGKTLASLAFALEHAATHGMRRVVYVAPFTAIIEQTARVFRDALGTENDVLEHHASFDWDAARERDGREPGADGAEKLRLAAENWDVPVVVTTAVQFFESLFSNKRSRCRKLHNIAAAVIVLDEAQTLPLPLLRPCMAALEELAANYGASVVLCTATQPALRVVDGFAGGFAIGPERELAPDPPGLYEKLRRVRMEVMPAPVTDEAIAARFAARERMLCIVNSRRHARDLYDRVADLPGAVHLSTLMCPKHRRTVLERLRERLNAGEPVRLVATSLIEAGVDISFPEVWRASAGLASIAQAAGRCNREGELPEGGRGVVFVAAEAPAPRDVTTAWGATEATLRRHDDLLGLDAVRDYFRELYFNKGPEAFDAGELVGRRYPILPAIREGASGPGIPFESVARAFRMIPDEMPSVVVPFDDEARDALAALRAGERAGAGPLRRIQPYVVSIPRAARDFWLARGVLRAVNPAMGDALLAFEDREHYDDAIGINVWDLGLRDPAGNVF